MSVEMKVDIPNLPKFHEALKKWPQISAPIIQRAIKKAVIELQGETIRITPVKTGRLRSGFQTEIKPLQGTLYNPLEYAEYVHEGTRPHLLRPVTKKALYWKGALHPVKSVMHPGSRPNRFMAMGLQNAQSKIIDIFGKALEEIAQKVANEINS